jgi:hypothetical protein
VWGLAAAAVWVEVWSPQLATRLSNRHADGVQLRGLAEVNGCRGHQRDRGVPMLMVVPVEELAAVSAGVVDIVEPVGNPGRYFQRLEVA